MLILEQIWDSDFHIWRSVSCFPSWRVRSILRFIRACERFWWFLCKTLFSTSSFERLWRTHNIKGYLVILRPVNLLTFWLFVHLNFITVFFFTRIFFWSIVKCRNVPHKNHCRSESFWFSDSLSNHWNGSSRAHCNPNSGPSSSPLAFLLDTFSKLLSVIFKFLLIFIELTKNSNG